MVQQLAEMTVATKAVKRAEMMAEKRDLNLVWKKVEKKVVKKEANWVEMSA